jgi:serine-type D-Ala-D-Ala carboxypeptidase (penicillin-binding protein 5/6)
MRTTNPTPRSHPHPTPPEPYSPVTQYPGRRGHRRRRSLGLLALLCVLAVIASIAVVAVRLYRHDDTRRHYIDAGGWPKTGQAAFAFDGGAAQASPGQRPVPIASVAKVMTARLVLREFPLRDGADGPRFEIVRRDVDDTARRRSRDESVVPLETGETLTERQALMAILLPSANNVAVLLARDTAGSVGEFVARMNAEATALGMRHTRYTDPSGFDPRTVSTAADQLILARAVAKDPTLTDMVATPSYKLPVAGVVHNTDTLLGQDGFVGTKTGSDDAAGGCFMFRTYRVVRGNVAELIGVVLGQQGHDLIKAALRAAQQLAHRLAPIVAGA